MNLNTFNYKCSRAVFLYQNRNRKFLLTNQRKEMLQNIRDVNNELNKNVIQFCYENIKQYYNVILYSIIFKEDLVSNEMILKLLDNILENEISANYSVDCILTMNKKLNDKIILKVLSLKFESYLNSPYDWRYYILKRNEISWNIKEDILKNYNEYELKKVLDDLYYNIQEKTKDNKGKLKEELKEFKNLLEEKKVYDIMKNYYEKIEIKKSM